MYNSIILNFTSNSYKKILNYCSGSVIIKLIVCFFTFLYNIYLNSFFVRLLGNVEKCMRKYFQGCIIWKFVKKESRVSNIWENSFFYKLTSSLLNFPSYIVNYLSIKFSNVLETSKAFFILNYITKKIDIILSIVLAGIIIVSDRLWSNSYSLCFGGLMLIIFVARAFFVKDYHFSLKSIDFSLVLFAIIVILSSIFSFSPRSSMRFFIFNATCFIFVLLIVNICNSKKSVENFLSIFLIGVFGIGLYGVWQRITNSIPFDPSLSDINLNAGMPGRVFSTMANPNNFAEILVLTLPLFVALVLNAKSTAKKVFFSILGLPPLIALFFTGSRSAWVAFLIVIFVFVFLKNKKLIPLMFILGLIAIPFIPDSIERRFLTIFNSNDSSANYRVLIFNTVLPMFKDYWVRGVGLGTDIFMDIVSKYYQYTSKTPVHTHILYMQIWVEMGIMGIISFIWFIIRLFKNSLIKIYNMQENELKNVLIAGVSSLTGILFIGCVEYIWFYPRVMLVFWIVIAIMMITIKIASTSNNSLPSHQDYFPSL